MGSLSDENVPKGQHSALKRFRDHQELWNMACAIRTAYCPYWRRWLHRIGISKPFYSWHNRYDNPVTKYMDNARKVLDISGKDRPDDT